MADMDVSQVTIGAALSSGAIFVAPKGTTLPTDASTALPNTYIKLGYTSDAGVQISESTSSESIRAWEERIEVYNARTEYTESIAFMPIQCNADVAKLMWGNDMVEVDGSTGAIHTKHHGKTIEPVVIAIETAPREGIVKRYVGTFQLVERGEQTMDGTQVDGRTLTFNSVADTEGVTMHEYTAFTSSGTKTTNAGTSTKSS